MSLPTQNDPFISIFMPCIMAVASGGTLGPPMVLMSTDVLNVYSSSLMPSMTWDLPVGLSDASTVGPVVVAAGGVWGEPVADVAMVGVFCAALRMITCFVSRSTMVEMFIGPASMSVRDFMPLMRCVVLGFTLAPACAPLAPIPPSAVVDWTIVISAGSAAEQNSNAANVVTQRLIGLPPESGPRWYHRGTSARDRQSARAPARAGRS